jgi:DNA-binding response OmpR family regulator
MADMLPPATRILAIDDDPGLLALMSKMLMRVGVSPETAETGTAGVEKLYSERFDLLILDLMLPDMDGFDILARVRSEAQFDHMPVLILSARADPEMINKGLELGADAYLTKPYLPNTLTSRVRALLQQGRRNEAASPSA